MLAEQEDQSQRKPTITGGTNAATLDAIRRMRGPHRPRAQNYHTIDGLAADRDAVARHWRLVAVGSSFMILGSFLMLPVTFEKDARQDLRIAQAVVGIFAVALLAAGFSFTGLLCFAVRNPLFQAENIFLPTLASCTLGLLTILYDFLIFRRYEWNTPALLVTVAAGLSTIVYGCLFIWTRRKINNVKAKRPTPPVPLANVPGDTESEGSLWHGQGTSYYQNYNRNMFPSAYNGAQGRSAQPTQQTTYDPDSITEEEMQRQQMLMLLLQNNHDVSAPDPTSSTFRIEWQGREDEEAHAHYVPSSATATPSTAYPPQGRVRQWSYELQPWDGVWREVRRPNSEEFREARRLEIERGVPRS